MLSAVKHLRKHLLFGPLSVAGLLGVRWHQGYSQKTKSKIQSELQDLEQTAIISYYTMEQIRDLRLNKESADKKMTFNKETIIKKINDRAAQLKKSNIILGSWVLKQDNINKVWEGFDDNVGAKINVDIWNQERFTQIVVNGRITLMPSHVTG